MPSRKASMDRVECHSSIGVSGVGISALAFCPEVTASIWLMNRFEKMMLLFDGCIHIHICEKRGINELSVAVKHPNYMNYDEAWTGN